MTFYKGPRLDENGSFFDLPMRITFTQLEPDDLFCPSIKEKLNRRKCITCSKYFALTSLLNAHEKSKANLKISKFFNQNIFRYVMHELWYS